MRSKATLKAECRRVNEELREEAMKLELGTAKSLTRMEQSKNDQATYSYWCQKEFQEFIRRSLETHEAMSANILIKEAARMINLSPVTTKRYMDKMRTATGPFGGYGDIVIINPNYVPVDEDPYWTINNNEEENEKE